MGKLFGFFALENGQFTNYVFNFVAIKKNCPLNILFCRKKFMKYCGQVAETSEINKWKSYSHFCSVNGKFSV